MIKFAHMGDCHLGSWRQPELMSLNLRSFQHAIDICIKEKMDFVLITGDLFDSAYPTIDTIKETFSEFRKLHEANIPVFLIAGSHDFSASGKSFLDVLEKAGFAKNAFQPEERNNLIYLHPIIHKNVAIYGYPGKKSALEVEEISRIKLHEAPGLFKILMLHTAIRDAVGNLPIPAVDQDKLPKVNYLALGHLHARYSKNARVYSGPIFPNNSLELEELQGGSFCIADTSGKIEYREIKLKEVLTLNFEIKNTFSAHDEIISELKKQSLKDKILILKFHGLIEKGKVSDIKFGEVEKYAREREVFVMLKNTTKLESVEPGIDSSIHSENIEEEIIKKFQESNKHALNAFVSSLMHAMQIEKNEDEKIQTFHDRLMSEVRKILAI